MTNHKEPAALTLLWGVALALFSVSMLAAERPAALASSKVAATASQKSKTPTAQKLKAKALDPKLKAFEGVWLLSKILEPEDWEKPKGRMVELSLGPIKSYLVFVGDKVCQSSAVLESEVICDGGYGSFKGKAVETPNAGFMGDVTLKKGQIQMTNLSEKGGSSMFQVYTKTKLKPEPPEPDVIPAKDVKRYEKEQRRKAAIFKKGTEAILKNFKSWSKKMEEEAPTFGYSFTPELLEQTSWSGPESSYHDLHKWAERARKELEDENYRGAYRFAIIAQEAFLNFADQAPRWRASYQESQRQQALRQQQEEQQRQRELLEEQRQMSQDADSLSPEVEEIQGAWQIQQYFQRVAAVDLWKGKPVTSDVVQGGTNYYLIFFGNKLCLGGFVRDGDSPGAAVECRGGYYRYDFDDPEVFSNDLEIGDGSNRLNLVNGKFEYIQGEAVKLVFAKTSRPVLGK